MSNVEYGNSLSDYIGAYGVDEAGDKVWALLNHNSEFTVVPEPCSTLLLAIGCLLLTLRFRGVQQN